MIFEKYILNIKFFISAKNLNNQTFIICAGISNQINNLFKTYFNSYWLSLIDITGVDLTKLTNYNCLFNTLDWNFISNNWLALTYYNLINYNTSERIIFSYFNANKTSLFTLTNTFMNANWLERELIEFFGFKVLLKLDTRNLLLDYNNINNPLLKNFPTEGINELFFNYLTYNLEYVATEFIEL